VLSLQAFVSSTHPVQQVHGTPVSQLILRQLDDLDVEGVIPAHFVVAGGSVRFEFELLGAVSPDSRGPASDPHVISIGIKQLRIAGSGG
jgi:hypothetical protein